MLNRNTIFRRRGDYPISCLPIDGLSMSFSVYYAYYKGNNAYYDADHGNRVTEIHDLSIRAIGMHY